ncbi:hypothetical protein ATL39_2880 [Sinobaca qinghaiensis]|uniref:Uncharacterized protein n=1 Tax=Sinobaca qinghaiensis TaxID=342944 RepID=A0A419UWE9_9BACL|nr:hypothetical protein ATL39_2880 [Sinobaca qinghaiensis]
MRKEMSQSNESRYTPNQEEQSIMQMINDYHGRR